MYYLYIQLITVLSWIYFVILSLNQMGIVVLAWIVFVILARVVFVIPARAVLKVLARVELEVLAGKDVGGAVAVEMLLVIFVPLVDVRRSR